jgi:protein-tyrosine phosphatase
MQPSNGVVVCCYGGLSRSGSAVMAYLILKRNMSAVEALTAVKTKRDVHPNNEFLKVLAQMHNHFALGYGREEAVPSDAVRMLVDPNRALIRNINADE